LITISWSFRHSTMVCLCLCTA